jgi:hypothetical protein
MKNGLITLLGGLLILGPAGTALHAELSAFELAKIGDN